MTLPVYSVRVARLTTSGEYKEDDFYSYRALWHAPIGENRQYRTPSGHTIAERVLAVQPAGTAEVPDGAEPVEPATGVVNNAWRTADGRTGRLA